jgi:FkbM family methyltransferase
MTKLKAFGRKVLPKRVAQALGKVFVVDHSQSGEGALLAKIAKDFACQKWVIDVGANDGLTLSNSIAFVRQGWRAILIEPAPSVFRKLVANCGDRDNVTCLQIACSDKSGEADLYFGSDGEDGFKSTLCTSDNEWFSAERSSKSVSVKTDTITNILKQYQAPHQPGILLVDSEGMDYEVLLGLDFAQFRPTVIVTEEYEWEPEKHASKYGLLIRAGYTLIQKVGCNTLWLDRSAKRRGR